MSDPINIFWFRRDLRLEDNTGLHHALKSGFPVLPVFIFDRNILDDLEDKKDLRVTFIYQALVQLNQELRKHDSGLETFHGTPLDGFRHFTEKYNVLNVFTNRDYEPYARRRDQAVKTFLQEKDIPFKDFKDQVIFERDEIVKADGKPYTVFTPYARRWLAAVVEKQNFASLPVEINSKNLVQVSLDKMPFLEDIGFERAGTTFAPPSLPGETIRNYHKTRDFPALQGTTHLGPHLRFGTISIRKLVRRAIALNEGFLNELIWREFFQMILWHFPHVVEKSFKTQYDRIHWQNDEAQFERWCQGQTGYPLVDAGMRELNATGFMHNRVRMVTASFLAKHLLIDWRWGEAYFAKKLLDYELASNNGNWQWAAGCGCDAAPYFRIFNPALQAKKFDPEMKYIKKWVPELGTDSYPPPMVEHAFARQRALKVYGKAVGK